MTRPLFAADAEIDLGGFAEPERTSILAILSLICSLVCFIPGLSVLGVILAIAALMAISSSEGRVGGRGLALAGLIVGLLVSFFWVGIAVVAGQGAGFVNRGMLVPTNEAMVAIENDDAATVRNALVPASAQALTDEHVAQFRDAYRAKMGSFNDSPTGFWDWIGAFSQAGQLMQQFQGNAQNLAPVPAEFDNGLAIIALQLDQSSGGGTATIVPIENIAVVTQDGQWIWLIPQDVLSASPPRPSGGAGAGPGSGGEGEGEGEAESGGEPGGGGPSEGEPVEGPGGG